MMTNIKVWTAGWVARLVLSLGILTVFAPAAAAQIETRVGTWELDLAKSTFSPGLPPQRQTLTYRSAGPQWTMLLQGVDASGKPINLDVNNLLINFDGRDHATPNADFDTTSWKRKDKDAREYLVIRKRGDKVVLTSTNVLSPDGKTMTITTIGTNGAGQPVHNVSVYQKQ